MTSKGFNQRSVKWTVIRLFLYGIICVTISEVFLRILGYSIPQTTINPLIESNTPMFELNDTLGWNMLPGKYEIPPYGNYKDSLYVTIDKDGGRITGLKTKDENLNELLFIGGSFTFGWGVNDHESYPWRVQEQLTNYKVKNRAVGGYGTYQSLMTLERYLAQGTKPTHVIYGLIDHHKYRDVATSDWLLTQHLANTKTPPKVPYLTLNKSGRLIRNNPIGLVPTPFSTKLVSSFMLQKTLTKISSIKREKQAQRVSHLTIKEMAKLCKANKIDFYVAILYHQANDGLIQLKYFLEENDINYIDCNIPLSEENTIPGDGHPYQTVHQEWSELIVRKFLGYNPIH